MASKTGKSIGGIARAASMTPSQRKELAMKGVEAKRALAALPLATHGSADSQLRIGDATLVCYVLQDETRLITQEGFLIALGRAGKAKGGQGAAMESGVDKMPSFLAANNLKSFINNELLESTTPIEFRTTSGARAYGYRAEILPRVCRVYLEARDAGAILPSQKHIVRAADLLMRGLAEVGIIALVDEATGYQKDRAKNALAQILEAFVAKELQPYMKKFPLKYYEEIFRLRGLDFNPASVKRPAYFGHLTNDVIYRRLAPGVWKELKAKVRKNVDGRSTHQLHRLLTPDVGDPRLHDLITRVTTIMQLSNNWDDFKKKLDRLVPPYNETMMLPFELEHDDGSGL